MTNTLTWVGIFFCLSQSAIFSGLNLALFSIGRLRLEVEAMCGKSRRFEEPYALDNLGF